MGIHHVSEFEKFVFGEIVFEKIFRRYKSAAYVQFTTK
jgi:hypothetical protein